LEYQHRSGLMEKQMFESQLSPLRRYFTLPGVRAVWAMNRNGYTLEFSALVDEIAREAVGKPSALAVYRRSWDELTQKELAASTTSA
jgi:hypothetical protein